MKKVVKKQAPKKEVSKKVVKAAAAPSVEVVKTSEVSIKPKGRPTRYGWLFDQLRALKAGQSVVLSLPEGQTTKTFRNRINVIVGRAVKNGWLEKAPGFAVQVTADNKIAVSLRVSK